MSIADDLVRALEDRRAYVQQLGGRQDLTLDLALEAVATARKLADALTMRGLHNKTDAITRTLVGGDTLTITLPSGDRVTFTPSNTTNVIVEYGL